MNEADIPIDIHTGKLQEWLVSRRIVPKNIQNQIRDIRNKIGNAVKDMPSNDDLIKLLSGAHINYFHCQQIVEILKQTEKDTKSVFGTYGSKRMKDWQEIVKLYEKESVYLGEAAQILVRNLTYEIPGLKKQISKFEQQSEEAIKKVQDLGKTEGIYLSEHAALCQEIGIRGKSLRAELTEKLTHLPQIYGESIKNIKSLKEPSDLYTDFTKNSLPLIKHLVQFGNTTVYEYLNKEPPIAVEEPAFNLSLSEDKEAQDVNNEEIDFGVLDAADEINFDVIDENVVLETGNIDWGETGDIVSVEKDSDIEISLDDYGIVVEGVGIDGGIAKGDQAYTILDSPSYRDKFIDELYELESFLQLRTYELNSLESSSNILFAFMDNISTHDSESVTKMLANITGIIAAVTSEQTQHLYHLKHSPKYASLLASKLEQKLATVEKIKVTQQVLKEKSVEFEKQKDDLKPVLAKTIAQTKVLQGQIERDISKRYKNRVVNLIGGINAL